jgi:hypothetical protein
MNADKLVFMRVVNPLPCWQGDWRDTGNGPKQLDRQEQKRTLYLPTFRWLMLLGEIPTIAQAYLRAMKEGVQRKRRVR